MYNGLWHNAQVWLTGSMFLLVKFAAPIATAPVPYLLWQVGGLLPYEIMLDEEKRAVVLSVRGSMSQHDVVTDLVAEPIKMGAVSMRVVGRWGHSVRKGRHICGLALLQSGCQGGCRCLHAHSQSQVACAQTS